MQWAGAELGLFHGPGFRFGMQYGKPNGLSWLGSVWGQLRFRRRVELPEVGVDVICRDDALLDRQNDVASFVETRLVRVGNQKGSADDRTIKLPGARRMTANAIDVGTWPYHRAVEDRRGLGRSSTDDVSLQQGMR